MQTLSKIKTIKHYRKVRGLFAIIAGLIIIFIAYQIHQSPSEIPDDCELSTEVFSRIYSNTDLVFDAQTKEIKAPIGLVISGTITYYPCNGQVVAIKVTDEDITTRANIIYLPIGENQVRGKLRLK